MAPNFLEIVGFITCFAGVIVGIVYICKFGCWLHEFHERYKFLRIEFNAHMENNQRHTDAFYASDFKSLKDRIDKLEQDFDKHKDHLS